MEAKSDGFLEGVDDDKYIVYDWRAFKIPCVLCSHGSVKRADVHLTTCFSQKVKFQNVFFLSRKTKLSFTDLDGF